MPSFQDGREGWTERSEASSSVQREVPSSEGSSSRKLESSALPTSQRHAGTPSCVKKEPERKETSPFDDSLLDTPLRRLIELSRPGSSPPRHEIQIRTSPSWEDIRPFGKASEEVIDRRMLWRDHLMLPEVRAFFGDSEHKKWYTILLKNGVEPDDARELVKAMHVDCRLDFNVDTCLQYYYYESFGCT